MHPCGHVIGFDSHPTGKLLHRFAVPSSHSLDKGNNCRILHSPSSNIKAILGKNKPWRKTFLDHESLSASISTQIHAACSMRYNLAKCMHLDFLLHRSAVGIRNNYLRRYQGELSWIKPRLPSIDGTHVNGCFDAVVQSLHAQNTRRSQGNACRRGTGCLHASFWLCSGPIQSFKGQQRLRNMDCRA